MAHYELLSLLSSRAISETSNESTMASVIATLVDPLTEAPLLLGSTTSISPLSIVIFQEKNVVMCRAQIWEVEQIVQEMEEETCTQQIEDNPNLSSVGK